MGQLRFKTIIFNFKNLIKFSAYNIKFFRKALYNYKSNKSLKSFDKLNLNENSLFVDLGGNVGLVSQYISDKYNCNILIFEPHPGCFNHLKKIFSKNSKIKIFNNAISNKSKNVKLYFHKKSISRQDLNFSQAATIEKSKSNIDKKKFIYIKTINLKKVIEKYKFIDLIKIDIETHEYAILPIIFKNLKSFGKIYCELHGKEKKYRHFNKEYKYWVKKLKKKGIYGKQFIEWH